MAAPINAAMVADAIGDLGVQLVGDANRRVIAPRPISTPETSALTFVRQPHADFGSMTRLGIEATVICPPGTVTTPHLNHLTFIVAQNPRLAFARAVNRLFIRKSAQPGRHATAVIAGTAEVDPSASIMAHVVIGEHCKVGAHTVLHPGVVLYDNVRIGENVVVNAGTVIGADGFGYERADDGKFDKFPHLGGVVIEADVEIGSNTSIDRGALSDTLIKRGAKIDNQVHISHNVVIGEDAVVIAQSMIGGSVHVGDGAWVAPSACVMNQRKVGAGATVGLQALVVKDVAAGQVVMGAPAVPQPEFQAQRVALKKLSDQ